MKQCTKCKEWKDESEFYKHKLHKDGLSSICKQCQLPKFAEYRNSQRGKETMRRYRQSDKGKEDKKIHDKRYMNSENGKQNKIKNRHNEKGRAGNVNRVNRWRANHPDKAKAHWAVKKAVEFGKIPKASTQKCSNCSNQAIHYHHYKGYEKEHWFDIMPLCQSCHSAIHTNQAQ